MSELRRPAFYMQAALAGLAAALKRKPTVARYTLYFRYLEVAYFDMDLAPIVKLDTIT
jgi:hypothetical protein